MLWLSHPLARDSDDGAAGSNLLTEPYQRSVADRKVESSRVRSPRPPKPATRRPMACSARSGRDGSPMTAQRHFPGTGLATNREVTDGGSSATKNRMVERISAALGHQTQDLPELAERPPRSDTFGHLHGASLGRLRSPSGAGLGGSQTQKGPDRAERPFGDRQLVLRLCILIDGTPTTGDGVSNLLSKVLQRASRADC